MKNSLMILAVVVSLYAATPVLGAGFSIFEQGAAATGMAMAFTARADDPSAVFYNPAGIAQLDGTHLSIGATLIAPEAEMKDPYGRTWESDSQVFVPPTLYATHKFSDVFSLGFGVGAYYGLGMKWDNNEDFIYRTLVNEVNIESLYFNPVGAFSFGEHFSVAAGLYYVRSEVDYSASIDLTQLSAMLSQQLGTTITLPEGELKLEGDNDSGDYGFNLGFQARFNPWRFGLTYRSEVECAYEGDASFKVTPTGYGSQIDAIVAGILPDTKGSTSITMPASASLGVAYDVTEALSVEFDINWMDWSSYQSLDLNFENPTTPDKSQPKHWEDVYSYRLGTRYLVTEAFEMYAGYLYDETPIPDETLDPILPDANRHSVQLGAGYRLGSVMIQASYMALFFEDRETTTNELGVNGDYKSFSHLLGMQLSYAF